MRFSRRRETPLERRGTLVETSVGAAEGHFGPNRSSDQPGGRPAVRCSIEVPHPGTNLPWPIDSYDRFTSKGDIYPTVKNDPWETSIAIASCDAVIARIRLESIGASYTSF